MRPNYIHDSISSSQEATNTCFWSWFENTVVSPLLIFEKKKKTIIESDQNNLRLSFIQPPFSLSFFLSFFLSFLCNELWSSKPSSLGSHMSQKTGKKKSIHKNKATIARNPSIRFTCLQSSSIFNFFNTDYCLYYLLILLF